MSFKPHSNPNANANAITNRFLSGGAKSNRQSFAPAALTGGDEHPLQPRRASAAAPAPPNAFSSLRSFISPISGEIPPPQSEPTATATSSYNKNVDFPILTTTTRASASSSSSSSSSSSAAFSYRTAVMTSSTALQQAEQARIQKEIEYELTAKEKAYEQIQRDTARSRDVATALAAAANYDIYGISESAVGCDASNVDD
jgi:hypothetical protein